MRSSSPAPRNIPLHRWWIALGCLLATLVVPAYGQSAEERFTLVLQNASVEEALEQLVAHTRISLLYDPQIVRPARVYCAARNETAEAVLRCILNTAGLDFYQLSSGTYVLIKAARQAARYGALAGIVVDEETGEPLPDANVLLADVGRGTATNGAGMFSFNALLPGPYTVSTSYVGYLPTVDSVLVLPDGEVRHRIFLRPTTLQAQPVVINGLQERLPSRQLGAGRLEAGRSEAPGLAGTADALRGADRLTGVTFRSPLADLHIQGGEAGEHQLLLDGAPVFNPVSLGRLISAFSPLALGRLTVHKAGFGVAQGSQTAGVIEATHDLAGPAGSQMIVQADPLSFNGRADLHQRLGTAEATAMAAFRYGLWGTYRLPALRDLMQDWNAVDPVLTALALGDPTLPLSFVSRQHRSDVGFSDLHLATRLRFDAFRTLYASFYDGRNTVDTELLSEETLQAGDDRLHLLLTQDHYRWSNQIGQVRYAWILGARALGTLRLRGSHHRLAHTYHLLDSERQNLPPTLPFRAMEAQLRTGLLVAPAPENGNRTREAALEANLDYNAGTRHYLRSGLAMLYNDYRFRLNLPDFYFFPHLDLEAAAWRFTGFIEDRVQLGTHLELELGTLLTFVPNRKTVYAEPRAALRYDAAHPTAGPYAVRLAGGLYRQFVNQFDLSNVGPSALVPSLRFWLPADRTLAPARAYHLSGELLWMPHTRWRFDLEGYFKWQPRLVALDYTKLIHLKDVAAHQVMQAHLIGLSQGEAYGGGFRVAYRSGGQHLTLGYTYSRAQRNFPGRFYGRLKPTPWNEPHRLTATLEQRLPLNLTFHFNGRGVWGRTWGFRQVYYDFFVVHHISGQFQPFDLNQPSVHRLPALLQLDAGLAYQHALGPTHVQLRLDLINIIDQNNVFDRSLSFDPVADAYTTTDRTLPGFHPVLSARMAL